MNLMKKMTAVGVALALAGCASQKQVQEDVEKLLPGPTTPPVKTITNFSDGLRCMDSLMIRHGVRDIHILVEDLEDRTSKVNAGTKDMLISAVSDMTRRSRAIKLIAFGNDSGNLVSFLAQAGSQSPYNVLPMYDIRGSISQLDSDVARRQEDGGIAAEKFGVGPSRSTSGSVLGLDLSVLDTSDLSVIPGVVSSNSVIIFKSGAGTFAEATIKKTGLFYSFSINKNEGTVQALRNLVELAAIELIGRLIKVPYWECLGLPADSPEVQQEMEDWFYAMQAHGELVPYIETQLRNRGFHLGDAQGADLRSSVEAFQERLGAPVNGNVDMELFVLLLTGNVPSSPEAIAAEPALPAPAEQERVPAAPVPRLELSAANGRESFRPGELVQISADVSQSGYLYCYFEDEDANIQRFFPNRFQQNNFVAGGTRLRLPGEMPFDMVATRSGKQETVACFASAENLYHNLPADLKSYDFESLEIDSLAQLSEAFQRAGDGQVEEARFVIRTQ
ncbi:MAG: DUF4384 domain-containing protein [Halioglobus sp.]|nr:DUF4384 domain-containing protein [Halioglobus sp.]